MKFKSEVIVIGAGFAGLSAALALKEAGIDTIVLEARNRVGGRVKTAYLPDGTQIDLGGQWIGPTQDHMYRLAKKYKVEVFPSQGVGNDIVYYDGQFLDEEPPEVGELLDQLDELALQLNLKKPWETPNAKELDSQTFLDWLYREAATPAAARYVDRSLSAGLLAVSGAEFSVLQMMYYIRSGGGLEYLNGVDGGAQQDRLAGGLQLIAERMAEDFGYEQLYLEQPVKKIKYTEDGASVMTETDIFFAKKIILAIPTAVMSSVEFTPKLPVLKEKTFDHLLPPAALKAHFIYKTPFWREAGLSGNAYTSDGYISEVYDNSMVDPRKGVLTLFCYGDEANELRGVNKNRRKRVFEKELINLFGEEAGKSVEYVEHDWSDEEYTHGCFSSHFGTNGWFGYGKNLNTGVDSLYWTGTEFASKWNGYCDGAVDAGTKAAKKIAALLQKESK